MLPLGTTDERLPRYRPWATVGLMATLLAIFLYTELALTPTARSLVFEAYGQVPARLRVDTGGAVLPLFAHMFLHGGWLHAIGNALFLWAFGRGVEAHLRWFFLPTYLGLGIFAAMISSATRLGSDVPAIGASGAIAGVMGIYFVLLPHARVRTIFWDVPAIIYMGIWFGMQVIDELTVGYASRVDYWAHIGGFLVGYALVRGLRAGFGLWPDEPHRLGPGWDPVRDARPPRRGRTLAVARALLAGHVVRESDLTLRDGFVKPGAVEGHHIDAILGQRLLQARYGAEVLLWSDFGLEEPDS